MNNSDIDNALGQFWGSIIINTSYDLCNHRLTIVVELTDGGITTKHQIDFEGVSSYFYVEDVGERRFRTQTWEQAELSEIYYFPTPRDRITYQVDKPGMPYYEVKVNFYIEIWSSVLVIEAKAVTVDGIKYIA